MLAPARRRGDGPAWAVLAAAGEHNLRSARVLEAHSDALAILAEAGEPAPDGTWGVFAAEAAPHRLEAREAAAAPSSPGQAVVLARCAAGCAPGHRPRGRRSPAVPGACGTRR